MRLNVAIGKSYIARTIMFHRRPMKKNRRARDNLKRWKADADGRCIDEREQFSGIMRSQIGTFAENHIGRVIVVKKSKFPVNIGVQSIRSDAWLKTAANITQAPVSRAAINGGSF